MLDDTEPVFEARSLTANDPEQDGVCLVDLPIHGNHGSGGGPGRDDSEQPSIDVAQHVRAAAALDKRGRVLVLGNG